MPVTTWWTSCKLSGHFVVCRACLHLRRLSLRLNVIRAYGNSRDYFIVCGTFYSVQHLTQFPKFQRSGFMMCVPVLILSGRRGGHFVEYFLFSYSYRELFSYFINVNLRGKYVALPHSGIHCFTLLISWCKLSMFRPSVRQKHTSQTTGCSARLVVISSESFVNF